MINSILSYIFNREIEKKYTELRYLNSKDQLNLINKLGIFTGLFLWGAFCLCTIIKLNFIGGISLFFIPLSFIKALSCFFAARKKSRPIYSGVPIKKSDRRYKSGYRIDGYRQEITSYVALTTDEINIRKSYFKSRMYFWSLILCISSAVFVYRYNKMPLNTILKDTDQSTWSDGEAGDSIYVTRDEIKNAISGITIYQLVRPINKSDIELLKVGDWKKRQMIDKLDTTLTKELVEAFEYNSDYFYRHNSSFIGICIAKDSALSLDGEYEKKWIEIIPTSKNKRYKSIFYNSKDGYIFENKYFIKADQTCLIDFMKRKSKNQNHFILIILSVNPGLCLQRGVTGFAFVMLIIYKTHCCKQ